MAAAMHFDTLAYAKQLVQAGVPSQQAEAQAEALFAFIKEMWVTKPELKHEMERVGRRIDRLEEKMEYQFKEVDHKFHDLEQRMDNKFKEMDSKFSLKNAELKNDLIKWVIGISAAQTALIFSVIVSLFKFYH